MREAVDQVKRDLFEEPQSAIVLVKVPLEFPALASGMAKVRGENNQAPYDRKSGDLHCRRQGIEGSDEMQHQRQ